MKHWLKRVIEAPLKQLEQDARDRLQLAGLFSAESLADVMLHVPESRRILVDELGLPEGTLLAILGLNRWPTHQPIRLPSRYAVGGVLAPPGEQVPPALSELRITAGQSEERLPDHAFLTERFGPCRSQGRVGACHAFATANAWIGSADHCDELSAAFLFWATKELDGIEQDGSMLKYSAQALDRHGICREQSHPYVPNRNVLQRRPPEIAFTEARQFRTHMQNVTVASAKDTARIKRQLAIDKRCIAIGTPIFGSSMHSLRFHQSGILVMRLGPSDPVVGGHAWCVCGYADNSWLAHNSISEMPGGGGFLIRNSWGGWAERNPLATRIGAGAGYALMPYAYLASYGWEALAVSVKTEVQKRSEHPVRIPRVSQWWNRVAASVAADSISRLNRLVGIQTRAEESDNES